MYKIYWLTGLPSSGKTKLAYAIAHQINAEVLDGDEIRKEWDNKDFSWSGRKTHIKAVASLAVKFSKYTPVIVSLVSPVRELREELKQKHGIIEIYVRCSLETCKKNDTEHLYSKAMRGEIRYMSGVNQDYEIPQNPDLVLDTEEYTIEQCAEAFIFYYKLRENSTF